MTAFEVGHGRECITPPLGIKMVGYASRTEGAASVHDDLFVNAVVLKGGDETVAIVTFDLCLLSIDMAGAFKSAIEAATGLEPRQVLLNTSHTHAGPALGGDGTEPGIETEYRGTVTERALSAVREALQDAAPATFSAGRAHLDIGCNRRERMSDGRVWLGVNPEGPRLPEVTVWRFGRKGAPHIVLFSSPMHGTTLGEKNLSISAEWMGLAVAELERRRQKARFVFLQGCGADQNPYREEATFDLVAQHGRKAADAVEAALKRARRLRPLPLRSLVRQVPLPDKDDPSQSRLLPLHGVRVGGAVLAALGCEPFVEYARYGRSVSKAKQTLVLGYTDGNIGYLCTADAFDAGGYEPQVSRVAPESEALAKDALRSLLAELADGA
jgi:neutral ceramidase